MIRFYLDNSKISERVIDKLEFGNPGLGATEYLFYSIVLYLHQRGKNIQLLLAKEQKINYDINVVVVGTDIQALEYISERKGKLLITRNCKSKRFYDAVDTYSIKVIIWAHNYKWEELDWISNTKNVGAYVCVSKAQMEEISVSKAFSKMTYIYNFIAPSQFKNYSGREDKKIIVCQGALTKEKGFYELARIWPEIKNLVPGVQMYVIGTGKLYDINAKLGKYGLADEEYEEAFMPFFLSQREQKKIDPDVHFLGNITDPKQKEQIIGQANVGVLNLTGNSECCPMSGIEMQALGVPVVTTRRLGCRDVVSNGISGYCVKNINEARDRIVFLLNNYCISKKMGNEAYIFSKEKFNRDVILDEWEKLIFNVISEKPEFKQDISLKYKIRRSRIYSIIRWIKRRMLYY